MTQLSANRNYLGKDPSPYDMVKIPTPRMIKVADLKPYPKNVKIHHQDQIDDLKTQISNPKIGWLYPIAIDETNTIMAGHGRLEAAKQLGLEEIPYVLLSDLTESQKKLFILMDNRINESPWNAENVQILISEIPKIELQEFQLTFDHIIPELNVDSIREEKDDTPPIPTVATSKLGEIYQLGPHRLMVGDSCEDIDILMAGQKAQMVFTDPPYNVAYEQGKYTGKHYAKPKFLPILNDDQEPAEFHAFITTAFTALRKHTPKAPIYVCSPSMADAYLILAGLSDAGYHMQSQLIWKKEQFVLGRADYHWRHEPIWYGYDQSEPKHYWCGDRTQDTIWEVPRTDKTSYTHPTQKPVELSRRAVLNSSREGDIIVDNFAGSGSTLITCEQTNRTCYCMELEPRYADVIIERWENYTGQRPIKVG